MQAEQVHAADSLIGALSRATGLAERAEAHGRYRAELIGADGRVKWTDTAEAYSGGRKTPAWSAASAGSKATSSAASFVFTSAGTVAGCFLNLAGSSTIDSTTGTLYSAGDFTGGSRVVAAGDTLNVSYTGSL
jgi:hypothetical protein